MKILLCPRWSVHRDAGRQKPPPTPCSLRHLFPDYPRAHTPSLLPPLLGRSSATNRRLLAFSFFEYLRHRDVRPRLLPGAAHGADNYVAAVCFNANNNPRAAQRPLLPHPPRIHPFGPLPLFAFPPPTCIFVVQKRIFNQAPPIISPITDKAALEFPDNN